jgi:hypothetical protein
MVNDSRSRVNGCQIVADGFILSFYIIFIGKFAYNKVDIGFVRSRKREFYCGLFYIT